MRTASLSEENFWLRMIYVISLVLATGIVFLFLGPRPEGNEAAPDVSILPLVNAILNTITSVLLITAYLFIRRRKIRQHRRVMLTAFGTSALFLLSYGIYHWFKGGPTVYAGDWRVVYLSILITHVLLAAVILPLALVTLYRGWTMDVRKHRKIARITLPLWLYVSVTGVLVYVMLYL